MPESSLVEIEGEIKWFDPRKGYGFIIGPEGQDIFVHFSVIEQDEGFRTFRDGERIVYDANDGDTPRMFATMVGGTVSRGPRPRTAVR